MSEIIHSGVDSPGRKILKGKLPCGTFRKDFIRVEVLKVVLEQGGLQLVIVKKLVSPIERRSM